MTPKIFYWINLVLVGAIAIIGGLALINYLGRPSEISPVEVKPKHYTLPKNVFEQKPENYDMIGEPFLSTQNTPWKMQLPDLQKHLSYFGQNNRPDRDQDHPLLRFSLTDSKSQVSIPLGEKLYLLYDRTKQPAVYTFSPDNKPTSLWIEAANDHNGAILVKVGMLDETGKIVTHPVSRASFTLKEKELPKVTSEPWEIDQWKVDGTLFARQKARWYGKDQFLIRHGGPEFESIAEKHRIDFDEGNEKYSIYAAPNDVFIRKNNRWETAIPGKETRDYPLLVVKKIDERIMNFELWNVGGKSKVNLNLIKSNDAWLPQNILKDFVYVGARTRSSFNFEVDNERMTIQPQDWLIQIGDEWKKLTTVDEIDDYLEGRLKGVLFVFGDVVKKNDQLMLEGTLFNKSRSTIQRVELPIQQGSASFKMITEGEQTPQNQQEVPKIQERPPSPPIKVVD